MSKEPEVKGRHDVKASSSFSDFILGSQDGVVNGLNQIMVPESLCNVLIA